MLLTLDETKKRLKLVAITSQIIQTHKCVRRCQKKKPRSIEGKSGNDELNELMMAEGPLVCV